MWVGRRGQRLPRSTPWPSSARATKLSLRRRKQKKMSQPARSASAETQPCVRSQSAVANRRHSAPREAITCRAQEERAQRREHGGRWRRGAGAARVHGGECSECLLQRGARGHLLGLESGEELGRQLSVGGDVLPVRAILEATGMTRSLAAEKETRVRSLAKRGEGLGRGARGLGEGRGAWEMRHLRHRGASSRVHPDGDRGASSRVHPDATHGARWQSLARVP